MPLTSKALGLAAGMLAALTLARAAAPQQGNKGARSGEEKITIGGNIDWIETSQVSALIEGVIEKMEFQVGDRVEKEHPIGYLYSEKAKLNAQKARIAAENTGSIQSAVAKTDLAVAKIARLRRLERMGKGFVSQDELDTGEAEVKVAAASIQEAKDNQKVAEAEWKVAEEIVKEHTILAPFSGIITDRLRNPGESVRANEPVVRIGRTDKLRFFGYLPLESAFKVKVGDLVEVKPTIEGADLPIEQKRFKGKVIGMARELNRVGKTDVQILAEIENPDDRPDLELRPGMKGDLTIFLNSGSKPAVQAAANADLGGVRGR
jgi:RND family efflux transporter MFP subunit